MNLDKDALELIQKTAQSAQQAKQLFNNECRPLDARKAYYQVGDRIETIDVPPEPRGHEVGTLDDLIRYAKRSDTDHEPVIWHSAGLVELVLDDADRRDMVTLPLSYSSPFVRITGLARQSKPMPQAELIRLLRVDLNVAPLAIAPWRRLNWSQNKTAIGQVDHGTDRLGNDIQSKVTGTADLPDELVVSVPVYRNPGLRMEQPIRLAIELNTMEETIRVTPLPMEIELAADAVQQHIRERLVAGLGEDFPIFMGMV